MPEQLPTFERVSELLRYNRDTGSLIWKVTKGRITKGTIAGTVNKNGYRIVFVDWNGYKAHRLVWLLVTGSWPSDTINHKNGQKDDNRIENLEDIPQGENSKHAHRTGLICNAGENNGCARLSRADVLEIRRSKASARELAKRMRVHVGTVLDVRSGATWKNVAL